MDCHRCYHLRYDGCRYGHCTHPYHQDVRLVPKSERKEGIPRPYNHDICREFKLRRKCSNCKHWIRGRYFADGRTPATKGHCAFKYVEMGEDCPKWAIGPTSWKKCDKTDNTKGQNHE